MGTYLEQFEQSRALIQAKYNDDVDATLFDLASKFVIEKQKVSISAVQRAFHLGYNRTAHLMIKLEAAKVVSKPGRDGTRTVLITNGKNTHLKYCIMEASMNCGVDGHPQKVMDVLGITYQASTPQSMGDQWWFWNCEGIPDKLPKYLTEMKNDPMECIGFGLSQEAAELIRDYKA